MTARFFFPVSRAARERYALAQELFSSTGNVVFLDLHAAHLLTQRINTARREAGDPREPLRAGDMNAMGLIDEILHYVAGLYAAQANPRSGAKALRFAQRTLGAAAVDAALLGYVREFPPPGVNADAGWLAGKEGGTPRREVVLQEILLLSLANTNPAFGPFSEMFDQAPLEASTPLADLQASLAEFFRGQPVFGPDGQDLVEMLGSPARAAPLSLAGQLEYIRTHWGDLLGDLLLRLLTGIDLIREEEKLRFGTFTPGPPEVYEYVSQAAEIEAFSSDTEWMPRVVMLAKNALVWMDQLSREYGREIRRLDQVPDAELDRLAAAGITALWLIGVWERSDASREIKRRMGNPDAEASAYSLYDYVIAGELGGPGSLDELRGRAARRGLRLASDMVPNHTGVDSRWMAEHPERFLAWPHPWPPFPAYTFNGPNISTTPGLSVQLEDHYWNRSDAAVVFKRVNTGSGDTRLIYHGNDGTHMPWNDTAQLDFLKGETREAVIQTILHVARQFPIIRFDAAMTLAKKHFQRLWYPEPGSGGDIPSRAGNGLSRREFDRAMPVEFWREVVDRVAREAPGTLLLAEAFWMLEGFFVRTLGMHRVYNSAFMNMLKTEDNAGYRQTIRNTLEFDPEVLKRFVNFMSNPDEQTALEQFGDGDKYFGVCVLMATLPGLPLFAHGQLEGYKEKYGMEFRRAYWDESVNTGLLARHQREVFPLLRKRYLFSGVEAFLLYDFYAPDGRVNEDVFAYSNRSGGERGLVLYNNRYAEARGWARVSAAYAVRTPGGRTLTQKCLGEGLGLPDDPAAWVIFREHLSGMQFIRNCREVWEKGIYAELGAYRCQVFVDFSVAYDDAGRRWSSLAGELDGRGVPSIDAVLRERELRPLHAAFGALLDGPPTEAARLSAEFLRAAAALAPGLIDPRAAAESFTALSAAKAPPAGPASSFARIWNALRPLCPADCPAERLLSWIGEWMLGGVIRDFLARGGWDARSAERAPALIALAVRAEEGTPLETLLADPAAETFLQVNTFEGVRWFSREALELMLACLATPADGAPLLAAAEKTGYRWDLFRTPAP
jgi:glycosidase